MILKLSKNGLPKKVSVGYSWKTLLVGVFYTMYRGDVKGVIIHVGIGACCFLLSYFLLLAYTILVLPFIYNRFYVKRLLEQGYTPVDEDSEIWLNMKLGYFVKKD